MNLAQDAVVVFANQAFVSMVYDPIVARFLGASFNTDVLKDMCGI